MITYINFDQTELDKPIYRIITVERFFELFMNNRNMLVSPSLWEDPFEEFISKIKINGKVQQMNKGAWGQCWTSRISETDAMWRIYTPAKNGVKIKTTARKLIDSLLNSKDFLKLNEEAKKHNEFLEEYEVEIFLRFYCGKVKYLSVKQITDKEFLRRNSENFLFIKRLEFKHEKEFRIVFEHLDQSLMDYYDPLFSFDFNFKEIVDEIVFDPRMDKNLYLAYKSYVKTRGFDGTVRQSKLYSLPKYSFDL